MHRQRLFRSAQERRAAARGGNPARRIYRCCFLLAALTTAPTHSQIALDTHGGDVWAFSVDVSGLAAQDDCDRVILESPLGTVEATRVAERFIARVPLRGGENLINAVCRKAGRSVARTGPQRWNVLLPERPTARVRLRAEAASVVLDGGASEPSVAHPAPLVGYSWRARAGNPGPLLHLDGRTLDQYPGIRDKHIELATPRLDGEYHIELQISDALGRTDRSAAVFRVVGGRAREVDLRTEHPSWVDGAIVYGAAPYFFEPPDFNGIIERLDDIAALGASVVWLSPVTANAADDFGYAVTDHFVLREQFGGDAGLRRLIEEAHKHALRVLVDFVPNHLSERSRYFQEARREGERCPYYGWFERDATGAVQHYFDWTHLKNLNYDNPQVRAYITAAFSRLVSEYDVDGFRVDASWAIAQRAPEFWPQLRAELKRIDPDILLLAEASAREPHHFANGFDAAYDWSWNLGEWAWREVFGDEGSVHLDRLRAALTNPPQGFAQDALILRFINNNDTAERFVTRFGGSMAHLAATLLFTLPGLPLIYNGDEAGAAFQPYEEGPPIQWNDQSALATHYRQLARLRRESPSLQTRTLELLQTDRDQAVLAFLRPRPADPPDADIPDILVLMNFADEALTVHPAPGARGIFARFARSQDLLSGRELTLGTRRPKVRIPPKSAWVLRPRR